MCTPDRLMQAATCRQKELYYYSCATCGKCEYNRSHTFSYNPITVTFGVDNTLQHDFDDLELLTDAAYIGVDALGYKVYFKSCATCKQPYNALCVADFTRQDFANAFGANPEMTYEQYLEVLKRQLENKKKAALENDTKYEKVYTFRVKNISTGASMSTWAQDDVNRANQEGILDTALLGTNYTAAISRLQFCSVAVRMAETLTGKTITPAPASTFTDTTNEYVLKAYAAGITSGTTPTTFSPDGTLDRSQMAAFLYRALQYVKANSDLRYTSYTSRLASYSDAGQVAGWAGESMAFMNALGLITGTTATTLSPNNNCTIEQAVVVANRSLNAHQIGWYQCVAATEKGNGNYLGGNNLKQYCSNYGTIIQHSYVGGDRIWVTGKREGKELLSQSYYPTTEKYTGQTLYVLAENWKPIRDK